MSEKQSKADRALARASHHQVGIQAQQVNSPLVPPEWIEAYERYIPSAGERFMVMVEKEQAMAWKVQLRAQVIAAIVALSSLASGSYLAYLGLTAPAIGAIFAPVTAVVLAMIRQRKQ